MWCRLTWGRRRSVVIFREVWTWTAAQNKNKRIDHIRPARPSPQTKMSSRDLKGHARTGCSRGRSLPGPQPTMKLPSLRQPASQSKASTHTFLRLGIVKAEDGDPEADDPAEDMSPPKVALRFPPPLLTSASSTQPVCPPCDREPEIDWE